MTPIARSRLDTAEPALQEIVLEADAIVPLTVIEGHRDKEGQDRALREGKTKLAWPRGKHNSFPSRAVDVAPLYFEDGRAKIDWNDLIAFGRVMGVIQAVAHRKGVKLRFGLDWDGDFRSVNRDPDESFLDAPHVELGD